MGYYITIKNELLEPKHVEAMGAAVWLYMLLIDKVMAINENGIGKVLNGRPVIFEEHVEGALGVTDRTYRRWIKTLREAGYIKTLRTPYGLVIYVNKAEKMWGKNSQPRNTELFKEVSPDKNVLTKKLKKGGEIGQKRPIVRTKMSNAPTKNVLSNNHNSIDNSNNNKHMAKAIERPKDEVSKLYYQVIKHYELPVTNHNVIYSKIRQWKKEQDEEKIINYLKLLLNQYPGLNFDFKPELTSGLDVYAKREKIRVAIKREIGNQQKRQIRRI